MLGLTLFGIVAIISLVAIVAIVFGRPFKGTLRSGETEVQLRSSGAVESRH